MFCRKCGAENVDDSLFCSKCGARLEEKTTEDVSIEKESNIDESVEIQPKTSDHDFKSEENVIKVENTKEVKKSKKGDILCKIGIIMGLVGAAAFLSIVVFCLIVYGKIYLFHGYKATKVACIIIMALMGIGIISVITKFILFAKSKINRRKFTVAKRVLSIILAVVSAGFIAWGFVDSQKDSYLSFFDIYYECGCSSPWATWDVDYLSIDTNPYDYDSKNSRATTYLPKAAAAIQAVNIKLGIPSYVYQDMMQTRALDGRQSYSGTKVNVSWRYHPDSGLEVMYTKK